MVDTESISYDTAPACQSIYLTSGTNVFTNYECGSSAFTQHLFNSPAEPSTTSSHSSALPTTTFAASVHSSGGLSTGEKVGIGVGTSLGVLSLLAALLFYCYFRKRQKMQYWGDRQKPTPVQMPEQPREKDSLQNKKPPPVQHSKAQIGVQEGIQKNTQKSTWVHQDLKDESIFPKFLSSSVKVIPALGMSYAQRLLAHLELYGEKGVSVRELIYLAHVNFEDKHLRWSHPSNAKTQAATGSALELSSPLEILSQLARERQGLQVLEENLIQIGCIQVSRADLHRQVGGKNIPKVVIDEGKMSDSTKQMRTGVCDGHVWSIKKDPRDKTGFFRFRIHWEDFLDTFQALLNLESPCLSLEMREIERYYYHAHAGLLFVLPKLVAPSLKNKVGVLIDPSSEKEKQKVLLLAFRILMYRFQECDSPLIPILKALANEWSLSDFRLQLIDLKKSVSTMPGGPSEILNTLETTVKSMRCNSNDEDIMLQSQLLVDLRDMAINLEDPGIEEECTRQLETWHQKLRSHYSFDESFAEQRSRWMTLIPILIRLKLWHELDSLPRELHNWCGYQLSRSGFLEMAERFIDPELSNESWYKAPSLWQYQIELATVELRQGQPWKAMQILNHLHKKVQTYDMYMRRACFEDFVEADTAISCLRSDDHASWGDFEEARARLNGLVGPLEGVREHCVASTRRAIKERILSLQSLEDPEAVEPAASLWHELTEVSSVPIDAVEIDWICQSLLAHADRLADADRREDAYAIYDLMAGAKPAVWQDLPELVKAHLRRRKQEEEEMLAPIGAKSTKQPNLSPSLHGALSSHGIEGAPMNRTNQSRDQEIEKATNTALQTEPKKRPEVKAVPPKRIRPLAPLSYLRDKMFPRVPKTEPGKKASGALDLEKAGQDTPSQVVGGPLDLEGQTDEQARRQVPIPLES